MAYRVGVCNGHYEFVAMLRRLLLGSGTVGEFTYSGTGNGNMTNLELTPDGSEETWTVSCINADTVGAELWSVTGSVSGLLSANATTGVAYRQNDISFTITAGGVAYVVSDQYTVTGYSFTGTGNGTIDQIQGTSSAITETWTVTCTDATTPGSEVWSVTGSTSGAQASATTGVAYSNTYVTFTITAGGTNFAVSDSFTFDIVQGELAADGEEWIEERYVETADSEGGGLVDIEMIMKGPGLSGTEEIWFAITSEQSINSDYYNISLSSQIGYVPGNTLDTQPGYSGLRWIPMWNLATEYWVIANGQRLAFCVKIETHYYHGYVGKYFPYATPGQFPYPIVVMGTDATSTERYDASHNVDHNNRFYMRLLDGSWHFTNSYLWPINYNWSFASRFDRPKGPLTTPLRHTEGDYPLLALTLTHTATYGAFGDLDGVYYTTGYEAAAENIIQADGFDHIQLPLNQGTGFNDYIAYRLD